MPFISIHTTKKLGRDERDTIKTALGKEISMLPNKSEAVLMTEFIGGTDMYFGGEEKENCAFVEIRLFRTAPYEAKKAYTELIFRTLEETLGLAEGEIYVTYVELDTWGTKGSLKM